MGENNYQISQTHKNLTIEQTMEFCNNQFLSALSAALAALAAAAAAGRDTRGGCGGWPVCGQPLLSLDGRRLQAQQEQAVPSIIAV